MTHVRACTRSTERDTEPCSGLWRPARARPCSQRTVARHVTVFDNQESQSATVDRGRGDDGRASVRSGACIVKFFGHVPSGERRRARGSQTSSTQCTQQAGVMSRPANSSATS
jgi:hypothetical protein